MDIRSLIIGSSMGGDVIGTAAQSAHTRSGSRWTGSSSDSVIGRILVTVHEGQQFALILGDNVNSAPTSPPESLLLSALPVSPSPPSKRPLVSYVAGWFSSR